LRAARPRPGISAHTASKAARQQRQARTGSDTSRQRHRRAGSTRPRHGRTAGEFGIEVTVCGCKNPDISEESCNIDGRSLALAAEPTLFAMS